MASGAEVLPLGKKFVSRTRTISEGEFQVMQCLTWQTAAIHTDREYMKTTPFGERIMSGSILLSVAMGLEGTTDERAALKNCGLREIAQLGVEGIKFTAPLHPGDSLWVESEILEGRPSKKNPKRIVIKRRLRAYKKPNIMVMDSSRYSLYEKEE